MPRDDGTSLRPDDQSDSCSANLRIRCLTSASPDPVGGAFFLSGNNGGCFLGDDPA
jgi:hypothetical protein